MAKYFGLNKDVYSLPDTPFAGGGEANIFSIIDKPDIVAKIYKQGKNTRGRELKLKAMIQEPLGLASELAWPLDILYSSDGKFAGFTMRRVENKDKIREIYVYDNRKQKWNYYIRIALNLSIVVNNFHDVGQVIGDLNPENILVDNNEGRVTLVDTDSFHIRDKNSNRLYRCTVGMPEVIPPELQGSELTTIPDDQSYNQFTDNFSLAVIIFMILMNGTHPFACSVTNNAKKSASSFQPIDNIKKGFCVYFQGGNNNDLGIPSYAPEITCLPDYITSLFKRAFINGHSDPMSRPSAKEWYDGLRRLNNNLTKCSINPNHIYYKNAPKCPWCDVANKIKAKRNALFSSAASNPPLRTTSTGSTSSSYSFSVPFNPPKKNTKGRAGNPYNYWSDFLKNANIPTTPSHSQPSSSPSSSQPTRSSSQARSPSSSSQPIQSSSQARSPSSSSQPIQSSSQLIPPPSYSPNTSGSVSKGYASQPPTKDDIRKGIIGLLILFTIMFVIGSIFIIAVILRII